MPGSPTSVTSSGVRSSAHPVEALAKLLQLLGSADERLVTTCERSTPRLARGASAFHTRIGWVFPFACTGSASP